MAGDSHEGGAFLTGLFIGIGFTFVFGLVILTRIAEPEGKAAVDAGVASWVADPKTGKTTLKYGCPCQEKTNE